MAGRITMTPRAIDTLTPVAREDSLKAEIERLARERTKLLADVDRVTDQLAAAVAELNDLNLTTETRLAELAGVSRNTIRTWIGKADWSELWRKRQGD